MTGRLFGILAVLIGSVFVAPGAMAADDLTASSPLVKGCEGCHGARGDSQKPEVPRLNGQKSDYILIRLKEFRDPSRKQPHASPMTTTVMALPVSFGLSSTVRKRRSAPMPKMTNARV